MGETHNSAGQDVLTTRPAATPTPNTSLEKATPVVCPFEMPLHPGDWGDDILDGNEDQVVTLYGDERLPETLAQRDYLIRAVNSFGDMLAALKAFSDFTALFGRDHRPEWFTDDDAWAAYVKADELRIAAIAKAKRGQ